MEASSTTEPFRFTADVAGTLRGGGDHRDPQSPGEADSLLLETKREIRRLVQEIAALCHSRVPAAQFWPRFLADVGTAMAADGGILWQRRHGAWISIAHQGPIDRRLLVNSPSTLATPSTHATDGSGATAASPHCHELMIREVAHGGGPVIVPPGGSWENSNDEASSGEPLGKDRPAAEPANPTESLAAVVPIPVDPDEPVEWMVELFLPLGGGPATHRGYLRFAAQMADLAADFLRRERLREARSQANHASRMHETILALYRSEDRATAEQRIVDAAANLFAAERVSLVCRRHRRWKVVAVNGVEEIDSALPAVQAIRSIAAESNGPLGFLPAERFSPAEQKTETGSTETGSDPERMGSNPAGDSGALTLRGVATVDPAGDSRLVVEDRSATDVDLDQLQQWALFLSHTETVLQQYERLQQASLRGWIRSSRYGARFRFGRAATLIAVAIGVMILGALPVPMVVTAEARLEPRQVQILYAPRDSVVAEMWVEHGDTVQPDDAVLRLVDTELDRTINSLLGRRAVLTERSAELRARLVSRTAQDADEAERLQTEQRVTSEELRSVASELMVLEEERERLVLRSDRHGIVDAWQIQERLANRPVRRGQSLFRIVAPDGGWLIEADVPQNRLDHVIASQKSGSTTAEVILTAFPDLVLDGQLEQIGPAARLPSAGSSPASLSATALSMGEEPTGAVTFAVDPHKLPLLQAGAPAKVGIDCGRRPLAYVACQDLVRTVVGWLRLYW